MVSILMASFHNANWFMSLLFAKFVIAFAFMSFKVLDGTHDAKVSRSGFSKFV